MPLPKITEQSEPDRVNSIRPNALAVDALLPNRQPSSA